MGLSKDEKPVVNNAGVEDGGLAWQSFAVWDHIWLPIIERSARFSEDSKYFPQSSHSEH
jgi:hypothetical protein